VIQAVLIAAGYLALIWASGWLGVIAAGIHIGVLCAGTGLLKKKPPTESRR